MDRWTEIKCYMCSRVCGELRGESAQESTPLAGPRLAPGAFCEVNPRQLRCSRCGGALYFGDFYVEYSATSGVTVSAREPRELIASVN